jgi:hypothetical protein
MALYITKASGEQELFDVKKFARSLKRVGADSTTIRRLAEEVERSPSLRTTKDIYAYAYNHLLQVQPGAALRYNLKTALYELGPMGFPFEQYVAQILAHQGYKTKTNITLKGSCITHEIDVIIRNGSTHGLIECKFHAVPGEKINIKIPLYVKARYDDIIAKQTAETKNPYNQVWIASNTQFTDASRQYARCMNIHLFGWGSPKNNGIEVVIDQLRLHPITILRSLSRHYKRELINLNLLLCKDVLQHEKKLLALGMHQIEVQQVLRECKSLYSNHFKTR